VRIRALAQFDYLHSCAIDEAGDVLCWGKNDVGQVGTGAVSATGVTVPTRVGGLP
jgi:alpha-tubulin suppressor-like RCC1 family protein